MIGDWECIEVLIAFALLAESYLQSFKACILPLPGKRPFSERPLQRCCCLIIAASLEMSCLPGSSASGFQCSLKTGMACLLLEEGQLLSA